jgi:hypothetical protein
LNPKKHQKFHLIPVKLKEDNNNKKMELKLQVPEDQANSLHLKKNNHKGYSELLKNISGGL